MVGLAFWINGVVTRVINRMRLIGLPGYALPAWPHCLHWRRVYKVCPLRVNYHYCVFVSATEDCPIDGWH